MKFVNLKIVCSIIFLMLICSSMYPQIAINEVMSSNATTIADEDGDYEDWIELYNYGSSAIDLEGYGLSDDYSNPFKWMFPSLTIEPDEYLLLWASGKDRNSFYSKEEILSIYEDSSAIWLFDETEGDIVYDLSDNDNHGTIFGATRTDWNPFGRKKIGKALEFNHVKSDYVLIPNSNSLQTTGSMTISMWLKPESFHSRQNPWDKSFGGEGTITLEIDGRLNFYWGTSGANAQPYQGFNSSTSLSLNEWTHIVVVRDFDSMDLRWYFNGKVVAVADVIFSYATASSNPLRIGRGTAGSFNGAIANPMLLSYALSSEEVNSLYLKHSNSGHTNFRISSSGEEIILTDPDTNRIDEMLPTNIPTDISYGRFPDGTGDWYYFNNPTPGLSNDEEGFEELLPLPTFSHNGGWYSTDFNLTLSSDDESVIVLFTIDGSEPRIENIGVNESTYNVNYFFPGEDSEPVIVQRNNLTYVYDQPLNTSELSIAHQDLSDIITTYRNAPDFMWKKPVLSQNKAHVIKSRLYKDGNYGEVTTNTYFIDPALSNRYTLPVMSLVTESENLFGYENGIYVPGKMYFDAGGTIENFVFAANYSQSWEKPVHIELYEKNGDLAFSQNLGMQMHGGGSRINPMKGFRLYARNQYDENSVINYNFFPDQEYYHIGTMNKYKRIMLRMGGNIRDLIRDASAHKIMEPARIETQKSRPVVHFVNGEYWGVGNIRDRVDQHHLGYKYGIDPDNIIILNAPWGYGTSGMVDVGLPEDIYIYRDLFSFIIDNDMSESANLNHVKGQIDLLSYIDYNQMFIYLNNIDWYGNKHFRYWRVRNTNENFYQDGKWRMFVWDFDASPRGADFDFLLNFIHPEGGGNGWNSGDPLRTGMLRNLLESEYFYNLFLNRFADHINTTFNPDRITEIVNGVFSLLEPEMEEHFNRWNYGFGDQSTVNRWINFANDRPAYQRQHIREHFNISNDINIILDLNDKDNGFVRINTININSETPGVSATPYPWTGVYFSGIPIEVEAIASPGYLFSHWTGDVKSSDPILNITPTEDISLTAHFVPLAELDLLHYWHFNTLSGTVASVQSDYSLIGSPIITYPGTGAGYMDERTYREADPVSNLNLQLDQQPDQGAVLRVRNPSDTRELIIESPTTGYEDIILNYATTRTSNGATQQQAFYSDDNGSSWINLGSPYSVVELTDWDFVSFDLSEITSINHNPDLKFKIVFSGDNAGGTSGNNRFDNISVHGRDLPEVNMPPVVLDHFEMKKTIEGKSVFVDLSELFEDPEDDPLTFSAVSSDTSFVKVNVDENILEIIPERRGGTQITVSANDGFNPDVETHFRVLVYPKAHSLSNGAYFFGSWSEEEPEMTYPSNMIFLQTDISDPDLGKEPLYPYFIHHDDYHADDQDKIGYPYKLTGRTRINGLGEDGISFINTGRDRDLGGALIALDTRGVDSLKMDFTAGTILKNSRIYGIRVQYRTDIDSLFSDLTISSIPVDYIASDDNDVAVFSELYLPEELTEKDYLQLLFKYYYVGGESGSRSQLRLDDISIYTNHPLPPMSVQLFFVENVMRIEWTEVPGVSGYKIYSSDDPYIEEWIYVDTVSDATHWEIPSDGLPRSGFYMVKSIY